MKLSTQVKANLISGIVILILAAFFSISLLFQLFDFGGQSNPNFLLALGRMLYAVYGFSSALIPSFLLVAGLSCFASNWTARKAFRLLTAIVPFFTCVVSENIIRAILEQRFSNFVGLKISVVLITGLMLVAIEFLAAGIIADRINKKIKVVTFKKPKKVPEKKPNNINLYKNDDENKEDVKINPVFDKAFSEEDEVEDVDEEEEIEEVESDSDDDEIIVGQPLLTTEEYEALTSDTVYPEETETETLTWDNVPPAPETLPPEYDDEIEDEEIDEEPEEIVSEGGIHFDDYATPSDDDYWENMGDEDYSPEEDENNPYTEFSTEEFSAPEFADEDEVEDVSELDDDKFMSENENVYAENSITLESENELKSDVEEENPFSSATYVDSLVKKNRISPYPAKIDLTGDDNDSEIEKSAVEKNRVEVKKSKYASKINLSDDLDSEENETNKFMSENHETENREVRPEFFDTIENFSEADEVEEISDVEETEEIGSISFDNDEGKITPPPKKSKSVFSVGSDVFSDMEADIREEYVQKNPSAGATNLTPDALNDFFNAQQIENTPVTQTIEGNLPPKNSSRARKKEPYIIPSDLLTEYADDQYWIIDDATKEASVDLKNTLAEFNIEAEIIGIKKGPVVTMFEILPAPGVKLSRIVALQDNIALRLAASSVRIVAPIPGKRAVGIEVPNKNRSIVSFRELIEQDLNEFKKMAIPVVLGKDILGKAQLLDLVKTPHLLIAGATGAGKSVCVNSIILSILYKRDPESVKLILVDPKVVELKLYNNIPHLLTPVITEPKKAFQALQYCLVEMERRYAMLDRMGVRDISSYNARIKERNLVMEKLPYLVVIIDEFADLMATTGKELENAVARLTAMSRAVGIHLVLATQRPSVNVITGLIKANIPSRIAFMVASRTDSSIIIDSPGAEKLLGRGDMLYASAVDPNPVRIQGTFVSDEEVEAVVEYVKQYGEPEYIDDEIFVEEEDEQGELFDKDTDLGDDPLYDEALQIVVQTGKASASYIQRKLKIGYNRAARLVEEMEERGIVGPANGSKPREVIHVP